MFSRVLHRSSRLSLVHNIRQMCHVHIDIETESERKLAEVLKAKIKCKSIGVRDISGGCGSMYEVYVESEEFKGKRMVQQHKIVNEALSEEVKQMHGIRISTKIPDR